MCKYYCKQQTEPEQAAVHLLLEKHCVCLFVILLSLEIKVYKTEQRATDKAFLHFSKIELILLTCC